jgi:hypothetical protein
MACYKTTTRKQVTRVQSRRHPEIDWMLERPSESHNDGRMAGYFLREMRSLLRKLDYHAQALYIGKKIVLCHKWEVHVVLYEKPRGTRERRGRRVHHTSAPRSVAEIKMAKGVSLDQIMIISDMMDGSGFTKVVAVGRLGCTVAPWPSPMDLEWGPTRTMFYDFRWFQAQIKVGDKGFSPRGTTGGGDHRQLAHDSKTSAPVLGDIASSFQGSADSKK